MRYDRSLLFSEVTGTPKEKNFLPSAHAMRLQCNYFNQFGVERNRYQLTKQLFRPTERLAYKVQFTLSRDKYYDIFIFTLIN